MQIRFLLSGLPEPPSSLSRIEPPSSWPHHHISDFFSSFSLSITQIHFPLSLYRLLTINKINKKLQTNFISLSLSLSRTFQISEKTVSGENGAAEEVVSEEGNEIGGDLVVGVNGVDSCGLVMNSRKDEGNNGWGGTKVITMVMKKRYRGCGLWKEVVVVSFQ